MSLGSLLLLLVICRASEPTCYLVHDNRRGEILVASVDATGVDLGLSIRTNFTEVHSLTSGNSYDIDRKGIVLFDGDRRLTFTDDDATAYTLPTNSTDLRTIVSINDAQSLSGGLKLTTLHLTNVSWKLCVEELTVLTPASSPLIFHPLVDRCSSARVRQPMEKFFLFSVRLPTLQSMFSLVVSLNNTSPSTLRLHAFLEHTLLSALDFRFDQRAVTVDRRLAVIPLNEDSRDTNSLFETEELWCLYVRETTTGDLVSAVWTISRVALSAFFHTRRIVGRLDMFETSVHFISHTETSHRAVESLLLNDHLFDTVRRLVSVNFRQLGSHLLLVDTFLRQRTVCALSDESAKSLFSKCAAHLHGRLRVSSDRRYIDQIIWSKNLTRNINATLHYDPTHNVWYEVDCDEAATLLLKISQRLDLSVNETGVADSIRNHALGFFILLGFWTISFFFGHAINTLLVALFTDRP